MPKSYAPLVLCSLLASGTLPAATQDSQVVCLVLEITGSHAWSSDSLSLAFRSRTPGLHILSLRDLRVQTVDQLVDGEGWRADALNARGVAVIRAPNGGLALRDPGTGGLRQLTSDPRDRDPKWSPNGSFIAFSRSVGRDAESMSRLCVVPAP